MSSAQHALKKSAVASSPGYRGRGGGMAIGMDRCDDLNNEGWEQSYKQPAALAAQNEITLDTSHDGTVGKNEMQSGRSRRSGQPTKVKAHPWF
jgi:hypothetical protein